MARLYVPNIIRNINVKAYKFLMRLNETRSVLGHEICKCICRLNSSVCNSKQIWNSDTCRSECHCDMWCKPGQYLDHKNCVCKNKLVGRIIGECTNVINEAIMNNEDNINNDNTV